MYKLINDRDSVARNVRRANPDGSETYIPFVEANTDYQAYLKWLDGYELQGMEWVKTSDGNEPLPADEGNE
jgi:hypothetical protein